MLCMIRPTVQPLRDRNASCTRRTEHVGCDYRFPRPFRSEREGASGTGTLIITFASMAVNRRVDARLLAVRERWRADKASVGQVASVVMSSQAPQRRHCLEISVSTLLTGVAPVEVSPPGHAEAPFAATKQPVKYLIFAEHKCSVRYHARAQLLGLTVRDQ